MPSCPHSSVALRSFVTTLAVVAIAGAPRHALAAGKQEQQLAQALFEEARALMSRQQYGEACPKLAESQRLDPGGGTLLNLASCHEKEGKLATAQVEYTDALAVAIKDARRDRERFARARLSAIEPLVPRIVVVVDPASRVDGLEIRLDDVELRPEAWGVATPVDPGEHTVKATSPKHLQWAIVETIAPSETRRIEVSRLEPLAALEPSTSARVPAEGGVDSGGGPGAPPKPFVLPAPSKPNPVFTASVYTASGAATVSLVTGLVALTTYLPAKSGCLPERDYCHAGSASTFAEISTITAWVSTVTLGVAIAATITALVVPSRRPPKTAVAPPRAGVTPTVGVGVLGVEGRF